MSDDKVAERESRWPWISRRKYRELALELTTAKLNILVEKTLSGFYRQAWDVTRKELEEAKEERDNWRKEVSK